MTQWDLIIDIGGSHARFATSACLDSALSDIASFDSHQFHSALRAYIDRHDSPPQRIGISAAGVKTNNQIALTNADLVIDADELGRLAQHGPAVLMNDFAAAAWFIDAPVARQSISIHQGKLDAQKAALIIGIGTGLGVGTYLPSATPTVLQGEGGHIGISPRNSRELDLFKHIATQWPEVVIDEAANLLEAEAILSGIGIPLLYRLISGDDHLLSTAQVMARVQDGSDAHAQQVLDMVAWHLGRVAGDLATAMMAGGGIFLCGGVIQKNPFLLGARFLSALHAGGRFRGLRESFPIYLCDNPQFGLIGVQRALRHAR